MSTGTVLVLTCAEDTTVNPVINEVEKRGWRVARIDPGDFPTLIGLSAQIGTSDRWSGRLGGLDLGDVSSVWYWRPTRFRFPDGLSVADEVVAANEARMGVGGVLASLDALWVNHPHRGAAAEYKPLQLQKASACGFTIPTTLITNDATEAQAFAEQQRDGVVCKEMGASLTSENGEAMATWTTRIPAPDIDAEQLAVTAHMIQAWVPKDYEARVTVVGKTPFAVAITADSEAGHVDWRSDYESLTYKIIDTPPEVIAAIGRFMDDMGLSFGAFDFTITPDGEWVFLECNPSGQWLWLEEETGTPITTAIAELLTHGSKD